MSHPLTRRILLLASAATLALPLRAIAESATATEDDAADTSATLTTHDIQMLNKLPEDRKKKMIFDPLITVIQPGDTLRFVATDKGHNSATIKGMVPEGAEGWKGKINEEIEVTLTQPGFYGYQCTPHAAMGMVGLIIVEGDGKMANYEAAKSAKQRGKAKKVWEAIWEQVEAQGLAA